MKTAGVAVRRDVSGVGHGKDGPPVGSFLLVVTAVEAFYCLNVLIA